MLSGRLFEGLDFGKLTDISRVDFNLPPEPASNSVLLDRFGKSALAPKVRVGAPIWSVKEWVGSVYPSGTKPADFLEKYTEQFNAIELNATHYRVPDSQTIESWKKAASPGFEFCPKFHQSISHERGLQGTAQLTRSFCEAMMGLGDLLGPSFLQLPPSFSPAQLPLLKIFFESLPRGYRVAVEFRHPAWFTPQGLRKDVARFLENHGISALISDVAGRRDVLHMTITAPFVLIRFVGNELDATDYSRIDAWAERLKLWISQGLTNLYFFVHQPDNALAPDLIRYFIGVMNDRCGLAIRPWREYGGPTQMSLFG